VIRAAAYGRLKSGTVACDTKVDVTGSFRLCTRFPFINLSTRFLTTTQHSTKPLGRLSYVHSTNYSTEPTLRASSKMLASLITRALQLLCAIIVLALSIRAAKWQMYGSVPATTVFVAFAGGFALLVSLVGIASIWISAIPALIMSMVDGFAAVLLLAGGIVSPRGYLLSTRTSANSATRLTPSRSPAPTVATQTRTLRQPGLLCSVVATSRRATSTAVMMTTTKSSDAAKSSNQTLRSSSSDSSLASALPRSASWLTSAAAASKRVAEGCE
jgi:hypothetical protein